MNDIADQLAARAATEDRPLDEVLRLHVLQGVLRRLAVLPCAADFVLRGSMLTRALVAPRPRVAQDLDFVGTFPHGVEETARRFRAVLEVPDVADGVCFEPASLRTEGLWLPSAFPGARLFLRAGLGRVAESLQIDVGFNDPLVPPARPQDYPVLLGPPVKVWCVRPETSVAWKLHGLAEMGPHTWRPKDLYDLSLLTEVVPLDEAELVPAIEAAFLSRGYALADAAAVFTAPDWWELKEARVRWAAFRRQHEDLDVPEDVRQIVDRIHTRLRPALQALGTGPGKHWQERQP